jgi:hypothetical protein
MKILHASALLIIAVLIPVHAFGVDEHNQHSSQSSKHHHHMASSTPLTAAGNYAFLTIQEAIEKLDTDPNTDWTKVNMEALREHLVDMENFTINVDVLSQKPVKKGMVAVVRPTTKRSEASLERVFAAHPMQLKKEIGWDMLVEKKDDLFTVTVTTDKPSEVAKIRGLGYIGAMAMGAHHQLHHWGMVKGENPHQHE